MISTNEFKSCIALNNIGVSLLKSNRYKDASVTFRDALWVAKRISDVNTSKGACSDNVMQGDEVNVAELVSKASQTIALSSISSSSQKQAVFTVCEIFNDSDPSQVLDCNYDPDFPIYFAISIGNLIDCEAHDIDIICSILLYNCGIAVRCRAALLYTRTTDRLKAEYAIGMSFEYSQKSLSILFSQCEYQDEHISTCSSLMDQFILVSILALLNMSETANTTLNHEQCVAFSAHLTNLKTILRSSTYVNTRRRINAASAA